MASASATTQIRFADEDPAIGNFQIANQTTTLTLGAPFICAQVGNLLDTTAGSPTNYSANKINPTFPGAIANSGNFKFGLLSGGNQLPTAGLGSWKFVPNLGLVMPTSDPALVCYSLSATGARKPSNGLFVDAFDLPQNDAKVTVRTVQLPDSNNGYIYRYYLDVTIPVMSNVVNVPVVVRDGFDSSVFVAPAPSTSAGYCEVEIGATSCSGLTGTNLDKNLVMSPGAVYSKRFIVSRPLRAGITSLPATGSPMVIGAVFTPYDLDTQLDNNVAVGYGALSDSSPSLDLTSTNLSGLSEGAILTGVSFSLSDDTAESVGQLLGASVAIDFDGNVVAASNVDCGSPSPRAGPVVSRSCTFDIVPPSNDFATDGLTPGTFLPGVSANVIITATDARGQVATSSLPLHIASTDNDAPVFDISAASAPVDQSSGVPTITCSIAQPTSAQCIGLFSGFIQNAAPAPATSVDELAYQQFILNVGSAAASTGYNYLGCTDTSGHIFGLDHGVSGAPSVANESGGKYALDYNLNMTTGSSHCMLSSHDQSNLSGFAYPGGQSNKNTTKYFDIVVTP